MMNKIILTFIIFFLNAPFIWSQSNESLPQSMISAFKTANSKELSKYFNKTIELVFTEKEDIYSATQAEIIIKDFFLKHPPIDFKIIHNGGEAVKYSIGNLITSQGNFRVTIMYKPIDKTISIQTLRFEKE